MSNFILQVVLIFTSFFSSPQQAQAVETTCTGKLSYFYAQNRCEDSKGDTFASHEYRCEGITTTYSYAKDTCLSYRDMYKEALKSCASRCATPPKPSTSATPAPSCKANNFSMYYRSACNYQPLSYNYVDYRCSGSNLVTTLGNQTECKTSDAWYNEVKALCPDICK